MTLPIIGNGSVRYMEINHLENGALDWGSINDTVALGVGDTLPYTLSVYFKDRRSEDPPGLAIYTDDGGKFIELLDIVITTSWVRYSVTYTNENEANLYPYIYPTNYTDTSKTNDLFAAYAQLEQASSPSAYEPTYGVAGTRNLLPNSAMFNTWTTTNDIDVNVPDNTSEETLFSENVDVSSIMLRAGSAGNNINYAVAFKDINDNPVMKGYVGGNKSGAGGGDWIRNDVLPGFRSNGLKCDVQPGVTTIVVTP